MIDFKISKTFFLKTDILKITKQKPSLISIKRCIQKDTTNIC